MFESNDHEITCAGKKVKFASYDETLQNLRELGYPYRDIPTALKTETWWSNEINSLIAQKKQKQSEFNLAIIVPIRGKCNQLSYFIPYLHYFLQNHIDKYRIFIIEQSFSDKKVFNRAALMNTGFLLANMEARIHNKQYDYYIFHDVNAFPLSKENAYTYAPYMVHRGGYRNELCPDIYELLSQHDFSGILSVSKEVFEGVGGFNNGFWGEGLVFEELFQRWNVYYEQTFENKLMNLPQIVRPDINIGKVWMYPDSNDPVGEKLKKVKLKKRNKFLRNNEFQLKLMSERSFKDIRKEIMKNNGYKQMIGRMHINKYEMKELYSFFSMDLLMSYDESRSWSQMSSFLNKHLSDKQVKELNEDEREYVNGKAKKLFYMRDANWIRGMEYNSAFHMKEKSIRNCDDIPKTTLNTVSNADL